MEQYLLIRGMSLIHNNVYIYIIMCIAYPVALHIQLQHYYEVLAEKLSADIAQTVVWEGAAKNATIKIGLSDVVNDNRYMVCMNTCLSRYFLLAPVIIQDQGKHYSSPVMAGTKFVSS